MRRHVDPKVLAIARSEAWRFARLSGVDREEAVGWAFLAIAELLTKIEFTADDNALVRQHVRHRLIDWQRIDTPLTRRQIDARERPPQHIEFDEGNNSLDFANVELLIEDPWVRRAILRLEPRLRDAIIHVYFFDIRAAEYGRLIGRTEERISQMLKEAREELRQYLLDGQSYS